MRRYMKRMRSENYRSMRNVSELYLALAQHDKIYEMLIISSHADSY